MNTIINSDNPILSFLIFWISCLASIFLLIIDSGNVITSAVLAVLFGILLFSFRKKLPLSMITKIPKSDDYIYILALLICFGGGIFSCVRNKMAPVVWILSDYSGLSFNTLEIIIHSAMAFLSFPFLCLSVKFIVKDVMQINPSRIKNNRQWIKTWVILSLVYCFSIITLIRANYIYKDDMQRVVCGVTVYTRESRFLAEYALGFLETNPFFADISPLTQILEMCLMALSAVIIFKVISGKKKAGFWDYIGMLSFGIFPFFLEPISFKYDAPQHGLAVFFAVLPLLFCKKDHIKYIIVTSLCIALSCSSHQVPMTVFPMLVILLCVIRFTIGEMTVAKMKSFIVSSVAGYAAGLLFYRIFIMQPISYNTGLTTILPIKDLIPGIIRNYREFFGKIMLNYNFIWLVLTALIFLCFFISVVKKSVIGKWKSIIIAGCGLFLMLALSNSVYPILVDPLREPRHMYSFGLFTGMVTIGAVSFRKEPSALVRTFSLLLSMCYVSFSLIYGNMLSYQSDYTAFRIQMVIDELNEYPVFQEKDIVPFQITGSTGFSPAVKSHIEHYPILDDLVTTSFNEYFGDWYATDFYNLYGLNALYTYGVNEDFRELNMPKIKDTYYYNLYSDGEKYLIELKERSETYWVD